jgi:pilus assembly protein CpaC
MTIVRSKLRAPLVGLLASAIALAATLAPMTQAVAAPGTQKPTSELELSVGRGQLVNLPAPISDVFVSNETVADVQVKSPTQIYVFAKIPGEASVYATTKGGAVAWSANVKVGANFNSIDQLLRAAMPEAEIKVTPMNGIILLTGSVKAPSDSADAQNLVQEFVGEKTKVISRLRTATPLQVNLQVKIAEVNRSLVKEFGVNLLTRDTTNGFQFGIAQGRNFGSIAPTDLGGFPKLDASSVYGLPAGSISLPFDPRTGQFLVGGTTFDYKNLALGAGKTSMALAGRLFGLDVASALDMAEKEGLLTTLAQPNLTALSGETASFLAGGEFPIPVALTRGELAIEYKQYGVSLAFTPTVLDNGRISMRVRPEVSELSAAGAVKLNGFEIPGISTRRAETTVELGSGQSFMIGGLLSSSNNNIIDRTPGAGNVPVLGALFRSTSYKRNETELVIIVTPYLVKPVSASEIALPTDGYKAPTDLEAFVFGKSYSGTSGGERPKPTMSTSSQGVQPQLSSTLPSNLPQSAQAEPVRSTKGKTKSKAGVSPGVSPGFSGN